MCVVLSGYMRCLLSCIIAALCVYCVELRVELVLEGLCMGFSAGIVCGLLCRTFGSAGKSLYLQSVYVCWRTVSLHYSARVLD